MRQGVFVSELLVRALSDTKQRACSHAPMPEQSSAINVGFWSWKDCRRCFTVVSSGYLASGKVDVCVN